MTALDSEFADCLRRIFNGHDPTKAWSSLEEMDSAACGCYTNYDKLLRATLTEEPIKNIGEVPRVLEWFCKLPFPNNASKPISDVIACFLLQSAEDFRSSLPVLVEIIQVITNNHEKYLPHHNNHANLCKAIVQVLSWIQVPEKSKEVKQYVEDLEQIWEFLKKICKTKCSDSQNHIGLSCFTKLCDILLKSERKEPPSSALVIVLRLVEEHLWKTCMQIAVERIIDESKDDQKIIEMLSLLCEWLLQPPDSNFEYLSVWLTLFFQALQNCGKDRIINAVAEVLPKILSDCLDREDFYRLIIKHNIIFCLLIKVYSLELYHDVIKEINTFFDFLKRPLSTNQYVVIKALAETTLNLYRRFGEHLKSKCRLCDMVMRHINIYVDVGSHIPAESEEMEVSYPSTSTGKGRLDISKVGLQNLGNTCYMNSVLQALVMTRKFCHEVLLYKATSDLSDQIVLKNLQNLFALLKYSTKKSLAPTAILRTSRPAYFTPGQQQDSSEFLCYLLDVMYEQEKSARMHCSNNDQNNSLKLKEEDKEMAVVEEVTGASNSPLNDDGTSPSMTRWTTEENLCEGATLQRKTQSLADFTQGEDLAQTQNGLSDSHSDSTDSGIQSVGGEDSTSSLTSTNSPLASSSSYLVHRVFGGELKVIYQCAQCATESHNTDQFRDLQLCFLDNLPPTDAVTVQDLINVNYLSPEKLTGENKYRCDKCAGLHDAERIIKIVHAPEHLILTLKHFRYDSESRLRTKLRRKVIYDETVQLPVLDQANETYKLYAAVVHSGYSMDYGHYITYACDAKNCWYKFNDNFVMQTTLDDFKRLEPPDTPYILFYKRCSDVDQEDAPEFTALPKYLQEYVEQDRRKSEDERRSARINNYSGSKLRWGRDKRDDDDDQPPPSNCRNNINMHHPSYLC